MTLRLGILGAARIAPAACISPAKRTDGVEVVAVAARDQARARAFASKHDIPRVHASYDDLLADPEIDAVYNPLPNGLHGVWTLKAIAAGKHVLCEKPFTANATEATEVTEAIEAQDRVVMEAFHYRYHPMMLRALDVIASGELGEVTGVDTAMCIPLPLRHDIRYQLDLAGGALMDIGCYAVHLWRTLAGAEPTVVSARAATLSPGIDRRTEATLRAGDAQGSMTCSLLSRSLLRLSATVTGTEGTMSLFNPLGPQAYNRTKITTRTGSRVEHAVRIPTYAFQMEAFRDAVVDGAAFPTTPRDAIATMAAIDAIYAAAGLEPRQPTRT
jgi:predicted dehydrogenase